MKVLKVSLLIFVLLMLVIGLNARSYLDANAAAIEVDSPPLLAFPNPVPNPDENQGIPNDGAFIDISRGLATLGDPDQIEEIVSLSLAVPASYPEFTISIFDGDMGDKWDRWDQRGGPEGFDEVQYRLFKDPELRPSSDEDDLLFSWQGEFMEDSLWCDLGRTNDIFSCDGYAGHSTNTPAPQTLPRADAACPDFPDGTCYYHLVVDWAVGPPDYIPEYTNESNFIKVASSGQLFLLAGSTIGLQAADSDYNLCRGNLECLEENRTAYNGEFLFDLFVPPAVGPQAGATGEPIAIDLYDGDFDRRDDSDDPNSPSEPCRGTSAPYGRPGDVPIAAWLNNQNASLGCSILQLNPEQVWETVDYPPFIQSPSTLAEDALPGLPFDDINLNPPYQEFLTFPPNISWDLTAPGADAWTVMNSNPSGQNEWELFRVAKEGADVLNADAVVPSFPIGAYHWRIFGADAQNNLFIHSDFDMIPASPPSCELEVTKSCQAEIERGDLLCESAIVATTLRYTGPDITDATVTFRGSKNGDIVYEGVELIEGVTVLTDPLENGWTINGGGTADNNKWSLGARMTIIIKDNTKKVYPVEYVEIIHTSCSAVYEAGFPAPLDAKTPNPPNSEKGAPSPNWYVESYIDKDDTLVSVSETLCDETAGEVPEEGAEITYKFRVTNNSEVAAFDNVVLLDTHLGQIAGPFTLVPSESRQYEVTAFIDETTTNLVSAIGYQGVIQCVANASASVVVTK